MNRPTFNNAQNSQMTYALDAAFERAVADDSVEGDRAARCGQALQRRARHRHAGAGHQQTLRAQAPVAGPHQQARRRAAVCTRAGGVPGHVPALARHSQAHHCHGAGRLRGRWPDAGLGVRPRSSPATMPSSRTRWCAWAFPAWKYFAHGHEDCTHALPRKFLFLGERMGAERANKWAW